MSGIQNFDNCTTEQHEQLLNWFFHRVKPEQRAALRADLPNAYTAFVGDQISHGSLAWAQAERARSDAEKAAQLDAQLAELAAKPSRS